MLKRLRKTASFSRHDKVTRVPSDVPPGHVAVIVGECAQRFIMRAKDLNHPLFKSLLRKAEEIYGFHNDGPVWLPCDESVFEGVLRVVTHSGGFPSRCRATDSASLLRSGKFGHV